MLNTYHYAYWGSESYPDAFGDHREIMRCLSQICADRLIFSARLEVDRLPSGVRKKAVLGGRTDAYTTGRFLAAAEEFFDVRAGPFRPERPVTGDAKTTPLFHSPPLTESARGSNIAANRNPGAVFWRIGMTKEQERKSISWLHRGRLRDVVIVLCVISVFWFPLNTPELCVGLVLLVLGCGLHVLVKGQLVRNVVLCTEGTYAIVRHPYYLANYLIDTGFCLLSGNVFPSRFVPVSLLLGLRPHAPRGRIAARLNARRGLRNIPG